MLQADAYRGHVRLFDAGRQPAPINWAECWSHARRAFFVLADIQASARRRTDGNKPAPISPRALEIVQRMERLSEVERFINGQSFTRAVDDQARAERAIGERTRSPDAPAPP